MIQLDWNCSVPSDVIIHTELEIRNYSLFFLPSLLMAMRRGSKEKNLESPNAYARFHMYQTCREKPDVVAYISNVTQPTVGQSRQRTSRGEENHTVRVPCPKSPFFTTFISKNLGTQFLALHVIVPSRKPLSTGTNLKEMVIGPKI